MSPIANPISAPPDAALQASLLDFDDLLLAAVDADLRLSWISAGLARLCGVAAQEAIGQDLATLLQCGDDAVADARAALAAGQGFAGLRWSGRRADGATLACELSARAAPAANGAPRFALHLVDVTGFVDRQSRAAELERRLQVVQEFGRIGLWERQLRTGEGSWDEHMYRFWDMEPNAGPPELAEVIRRVPTEDGLGAIYADSLQQAGSYAARYRVRHGDGSFKRLQSQWRVVDGADGRPERAIGIVSDDTEVYRLAHQLEAANARLAMLVELCRVGIWRHDLASGLLTQHGHGLAFLGRPERPEGLSMAEVSGWVHADDLSAVQASARRTLTSGEPTDCNARYRHADGRWVHVLTRRALELGSDGKPLAFLGVSLDVSEQHAARDALAEARERVALIARSVGIDTWELDPTTGVGVWDEQMFRLNGLAPQPQTPPLAERRLMVHPDDLEIVKRLTGDIQRAQQGEFRVVWPDGAVHWIAARTRHLAASEERPARVIGVNWDITELKAAEAARDAQRTAQRQNQAKTEFLARMSHELRTPLNAVLGFTQLLLLEGEGGERANRQQRLNHVLSAGRHLLSLIDDVLDLSRLEVGGVSLVLGAVPLDALVVETLPLIEPLARERGIRIVCGRLDGQPRADATRLRQVLLNLLSNAIKYNSPGGSVLVESRAEPRADGGLLRLSVSDNGQGLSAAQLGQVFEPFNRAGAERSGVEGSGIGLAVVKALVEKMDGSILVHSRPGEGSRFEVVLPLAGDDDAPTVPAPWLASDGEAVAPPPAPVRGRLLYIEDNPVNTLVVEETLRLRPDLSLQCAVDGHSGVELAMQLRPDLILLDMQLPDFDGHEVLRRLRADPRTAAIRCIAVSANAMPEDIDRALRAGFADYWVKPLDLSAFLRALDDCFAAPSVASD
ncbi:MAG: PAS domain-containing protein [Rubrivivax sp.]|nr:PAS domain-containing protein [Rubrivivax sp.]